MVEQILELEPKVIPDEIDIGLACDADLKTVWESADETAITPSNRITVSQAEYSHQRGLIDYDPPQILTN